MNDRSIRSVSAGQRPVDVATLARAWKTPDVHLLAKAATLTFVCCFWLSCNSASDAAEPEMRFRFAEGSTFAGRLAAAEESGRIRIRSELFAQPMEVATDRLLEGRMDRPIQVASDRDQTVEGASAFAFLLSDGSQFVGTVADWGDDSVSIDTLSLGRVDFRTDRVVSVFEQKEMPDQILSLANSKFRFRHESGWSFGAAGLRCTKPDSATVADFELPDRFRIRLEIKCDGDADFELSLGDRSADGAGQGGGRVDRRGGSLSRLPTERFVTRVEWIGQSVSLVRSNASVSDAAVFELMDQAGRLEIDLYFDQTRGRLIAMSDGLLMADATLMDETPVIRSVLTLISRRDPVEVRGLDLYQWDGRVPTSRLLPDRFTLLRDGTLIEAVADLWDQGRFRVNENWYDLGNLSRMSFQVARRRREACEMTLIDGDRIRGSLDGSARPGDRRFGGEAAGELIRINASMADSLIVDSSRVARVVGTANDVRVPDDLTSELIADGVRLRGQLLDGGGVGTTFGWRPEVGQSDLGIVAKTDVEIRFGATTREDAVADSFLELRSGDRLPGEFTSCDKDGVRFRSAVCGEVAIASDDVSRIRLKGTAKLDVSDLELLLSLPRQMKDSPPTHLLVSADGDVLRGRLLSMDHQEARIEVRGRTRVVERARLAEIIWLDQQAVLTKPCRYVVATHDGGQLGLETAEFDGAELPGTHRVLGACRIPLGAMQSLRFGTRESVPGGRWKLVPVKEPKTFE